MSLYGWRLRNDFGRFYGKRCTVQASVQVILGYLNHLTLISRWISHPFVTIKQIFTYITDFPEVLQFFEELTQKSENLENSDPNNSSAHSFSVSETTEQFVLHSIIKIKTTKEQSQQTTLIDSVLDKFLYKNDSLTELFVSNIYTKNIKMGSYLIRYLIDTKQFTKILENLNFNFSYFLISLVSKVD